MGGIDIAIIEAPSESDLRKLSDLFISKFQNGAVVLYNNKGSVLVRVSKGAAKLHAGETLKDILTVVNGKGGGKVDIAQGSGDIALISKIKDQAFAVLASKLE
jgi:alanyl-tRNA synthetase